MAKIGARKDKFKYEMCKNMINENKIHETFSLRSMTQRLNEYQLRNFRHFFAPHVQGILSSSNGNL